MARVVFKQGEQKRFLAEVCNITGKELVLERIIRSKAIETSGK